MALMVECAVSSFGRLDGAFNKAGVEMHNKLVYDLDAGEWDSVLDVNAKGMFLCMKHEIEAKRKTGGGAIVNNSSMNGVVPLTLRLRPLQAVSLYPDYRSTRTHPCFGALRASTVHSGASFQAGLATKCCNWSWPPKPSRSAVSCMLLRSPGPRRPRTYYGAHARRVLRQTSRPIKGVP